jgi:hypothetical protein
MCAKSVASSSVIDSVEFPVRETMSLKVVDTSASENDMIIERLRTLVVMALTPKRVGDARGSLSETFRQNVFDAIAGPTASVAGQPVLFPCRWRHPEIAL